MRILLLAAGATFLAMLDATVANLAVADLRFDFPSASISDLSWVVSAYAIAFAALLTPAGRLAGVLGPRRLFAGGVGLFTLMSLAGAAAPDLGLLVGARALQGAGAAAMIPASLAVLLFAAPPERRASAIGLWSAAAALAAAAGPSIGGLLVEGFGWRSVFVINVPLGLAVVAGARALLPATGGTGGRLPDVVGTVLLAAGIGGVVLGLTEAETWGWGDPRTVVALGGGALAVAAALARSTGHAAPAVETALWRSRTFAVANVASLLYGLALYPWLLLGVFVLTQGWGYSVLEAGLAMSPGAVVAAAAAVVSGRLCARFGVRPVVAAGGLILAGAGLWATLALPRSPAFVGFWLPVGTVIGIGMGMLTTGTSTAAALAVAPTRFAAATGMNTTARQVGGALGIAALALILSAVAGFDGFERAYLFCTAAALAAAIAGLALGGRPVLARASAPAAVPEGSL
jgi:EmrB/QacA subfamily drug resistance transporter